MIKKSGEQMRSHQCSRCKRETLETDSTTYKALVPARPYCLLQTSFPLFWRGAPSHSLLSILLLALMQVTVNNCDNSFRYSDNWSTTVTGGLPEYNKYVYIFQTLGCS